MNEGRPGFHAELAGHVFKDNCGNILNATKSADRLKYLQLYEQPDLRCRCPSYRGGPLSLIEIRAESLVHVLWSQGVGKLGVNHTRSAARRCGIGNHEDPTVFGCWRGRSIFHKTRRRPITAFPARLFRWRAAVAGFYTNLTGGRGSSPHSNQARSLNCDAALDRQNVVVKLPKIANDKGDGGAVVDRRDCFDTARRPCDSRASPPFPSEISTRTGST
jgi:hypothetical protein